MQESPRDERLARNLRDHVYKLSAEIGERSIFNYQNLELAADYIAEQFGKMGYKVDFQTYTVEDKEIKNIIATKIGTKSPEEVVIVGAHYDSCFNPGADDNASGVAGILELARLMRNKPVDRTIKFAAFVNEEPPFFQTEAMGSRIFAREAKKNNLGIKAVVVLDLIGYYTNNFNSQRYLPIIGIFFPNRGNFVGVFGNFQSRHLVSSIVKEFKQHSSFPLQSIALDHIPATDFSDHWSFWKEGYPAVMVSDTAFLRHRNYHKATDTWEKLNYNAMACVIEGIYPAIIALCRSDK
jgi:Zn-dependent M28 family amino/carboxypeptidase